MTLTEKLVLKKAEEKDADLLFSWINDPEVREQSLSKEKVAYEDHIKWFSKKIVDSNCYLYIVYTNVAPVGMIRFDINSNTATLSYLVEKSQRGKGIGFAIVEAGLKKFLNETAFRGIINAVVKISNFASIKIFERVGFERHGVNNNLIHFKKIFA